MSWEQVVLLSHYVLQLVGLVDYPDEDSDEEDEEEEEEESVTASKRPRLST